MDDSTAKTLLGSHSTQILLDFLFYFFEGGGRWEEVFLILSTCFRRFFLLNVWYVIVYCDSKPSSSLNWFRCDVPYWSYCS